MTLIELTFYVNFCLKSLLVRKKFYIFAQNLECYEEVYKQDSRKTWFYS